MIRPSARGSDRGQLVVLAAAVVAVALVAMVAAYLQVAGATGAAGPAVADRGDGPRHVHAGGEGETDGGVGPVAEVGVHGVDTRGGHLDE